MKEFANMDHTFPQDLNSHTLCLKCISRYQCINSNLTLAQVKQLSNVYVQKIYLKKGESLHHNGDKLQSIYSIRAGTLKTESSLSDGRHQVIKFHLPGEVVGLDGLQDGQHRTTSTALRDSEICRFNYHQLISEAKSYPALQENLDKLMSSMLNDAQNHIFILGSFNATEKLASFLFQFSKKLSSPDLPVNEFKLPMSREDLSSYLGITIETLSRSFSYLSDKKILRASNKNITVLEREKLEAIYCHE